MCTDERIYPNSIADSVTLPPLLKKIKYYILINYSKIYVYNNKYANVKFKTSHKRKVFYAFSLIVAYKCKLDVDSELILVISPLNFVTLS